MRYIKVGTVEWVPEDSPRGKKAVAKRAREAKKLAKQREQAEQKKYFDELAKQKAEAESVLAELKDVTK